MVGRQLIAAITALDSQGNEGEGQDPDSVKDYLEDAVVML